MKIWVIGRHYPTIRNRMRGSFELEQAKMLARGGHEVTYISVVFHPRKKIRNWGIASWKEDGIRIVGYSVPFFPQKMNIEMNRVRAMVQKKVLRSIEKSDGLPDIIHVHYPTWIIDSDVVLQYQDKKCAIVCTEHWSNVLEEKLTKIQKHRLQKFVDKADAFICVGEQLKNAISRITGTNRHFYIVANVVDSLFSPQHKVQKGYSFVFAGRLVKIKQIDKILEAFASIVKDYSDTKLVIVGTGEELETLKNLSKSLGIEASVVFTGTVDREQVANHIANADCLVCFSEFETFGVTVIEAWACGVPAICSSTAGVASYWQNDLGFLVNPNSVEELSSKMRLMINKQWDHEWISSYAQENFSEVAIRSQLDNIYKTVVQ